MSIYATEIHEVREVPSRTRIVKEILRLPDQIRSAERDLIYDIMLLNSLRDRQVPSVQEIRKAEYAVEADHQKVIDLRYALINYQAIAGVWADDWSE